MVPVGASNSPVAARVSRCFVLFVLCRRRFGRSALAGYRFPPEVILLAVRWYLRYGLSYRGVLNSLCEVVHRPSALEPSAGTL